jgi:hypothetical protein
VGRSEKAHRLPPLWKKGEWCYLLLSLHELTHQRRNLICLGIASFTVKETG